MDVVFAVEPVVEDDKDGFESLYMEDTDILVLFCSARLPKVVSADSPLGIVVSAAGDSVRTLFARCNVSDPGDIVGIFVDILRVDWTLPEIEEADEALECRSTFESINCLVAA